MWRKRAMLSRVAESGCFDLDIVLEGNQLLGNFHSNPNYSRVMRLGEGADPSHTDITFTVAGYYFA
jgi:hypothetical protein